jgi:hypothetical protein
VVLALAALDAAGGAAAAGAATFGAAWRAEGALVFAKAASKNARCAAFTASARAADKPPLWLEIGGCTPDVMRRSATENLSPDCRGYG